MLSAEFFSGIMDGLPDNSKDARILKKRSIPSRVKEEIIASHVNAIEALVPKHPELCSWEIGCDSPKVTLLAEYINGVFYESNRQREVVSARDIAGLFDIHLSYERSGLNMRGSALGYTALSTLVFAGDRLCGVVDPGGLLSYACIPPESQELLAG